MRAVQIADLSGPATALKLSTSPSRPASTR